MGRPKLENSKSIRLQFRFDNETLEKLDTCVKSQNSNRSEIVRQGINKVYDEIKK